MAARRWRRKWHVDFMLPDGTRVRKVSPVQTRRGTEEFEAEIRAELLARGSSISTPSGDGTRKEEPRFADFAVEWLETYAVTNNKYTEVRTKEHTLRNHLIPAFGHLKLSEIDLRGIEQYKASKLSGKKPLAQKTVNNHLSILRKSLVTAQEWGMLDTVPRIKWLRPPPPGFDFLTPEESERLLEAASVDLEWHVMVLMALRTGLRQGELRALRWEDLDLVEATVTVRRTVWGGIFTSPKSNKFRTVPLSAQLVDGLKQLRHLKGELVFCKEDGSRWRHWEVRPPLKRICRRAGLRQIQWHSLRHSFASHLAMKAQPLKVIQELLGHSTIQMTMRYAHLAPSVHRDAVQVLDEPVRRAGKTGSNREKTGTFLEHRGPGMLQVPDVTDD